jgi:hypothetical protein
MCAGCCRYHVHVAAEAYGLAHSSHNEGADRVIKVGAARKTQHRLPNMSNGCLPSSVRERAVIE